LKSSQHAGVNTIDDIDVHGHRLGGAGRHPEAILELVLLETSALNSDRTSLVTAKWLHKGVDFHSLAAEDHVLAIQLCALDHTNSHVSARVR
jgi:hypothetical protein